MLPVTKIAIGFVCAFSALRFNGFDGLLDPVGWGLCAAGLSQLQRSTTDSFGQARFFAFAMVCISAVAVLVFVGRSSSTLTASPIWQVIGFANIVGSLITVWLVVDAIVRRIRSSGDLSRIPPLDVLRWVVVGSGVLSTLVAYGFVSTDLALVAVIAWFASVVALIIMLFRSARMPCLSPTWEPMAS